MEAARSRRYGAARRYVGTHERRHKRKEVRSVTERKRLHCKEMRRQKKEICERRHGQTHKRGHQRRTVKRCSFGENGGGSRGDMWKRTLSGTLLETHSWKKKLHAMRTNASERIAVMADLCCNRDTPDGLRPWMTHARARTVLRRLQPAEEPMPIQRSSRKQRAVWVYWV